MGFFPPSPGSLHHQVIYYSSEFFVCIHKGNYSDRPALAGGANRLYSKKASRFHVGETIPNEETLNNLVGAFVCIKYSG